jgi:hypothetical protein
MANSQPKTEVVALRVSAAEDFDAVSEFASDLVGAEPPFGGVELPMPLDQISYRHPGPEDRPHLART